MNLITETKTRLNYTSIKLIDLQECFKVGYSTKDAEYYLKSEISRAKKNIKYYTEILKILENDKEDK